MKNRSKMITCLLALTAAFLGTAAHPQHSPVSQTGDSSPPSRVVKLIFIHHSTGENWLSDGFGNLGASLGQNNYFVSDTNYGWGPNSIGDRTDIPDWQEWFKSGSTTETMEALFQESEQSAGYTRTLSDPGGENEIILFKSCFPNSDLEGSPEDPPTTDGWLSVGHAKYVYNDILLYFKAHPEKLFIVITAPPLSDPANANNARAFNQWLVHDWLVENEYPYNNVAVFDFYNVLTGSDGHHFFREGEEIHQPAKKNTLHYPSGDDHPSKTGSRKATEEFVPLLNYFYNRWQMDAPALLPAEAEGSEPGNDTVANPPVLSGMIDNFDGVIPDGTAGWEAFWDESTPTSMNCILDPEKGINGGGLKIDFNITRDSWGTCALFYDKPQDWSSSKGIAFSILTGQAGNRLDVDLYVDGPEGLETYVSQLELTSEMVNDWMSVGFPWEGFHRVDWEAEAGSTFEKQDQISGLAFGFSVEEGGGSQGSIQVEDLGWLESGEGIELAVPQEETSAETYEGTQPRRSLPCFGSLSLPLGMVGVIILRKRNLIGKV